MTRTFAAALLLAVPVAALAQETRPEEVIRTAIAAAGGAETLARFPAGRVVAKGVIVAGGTETPVTVEQLFQLPGQIRTVIRSEPRGQRLEVQQIVNGTRSRHTINGTTIPITDAAAQELRHALLLQEIGQLAPLLTDRKFTLKTDRRAKNPKIAGVLVHVKGSPDLRLGFDRKTGHLVRIAHKAPDPGTGKEAEFELVFSDFRAFGGLTRPTRTVLSRDGVRVLELTTESFTPLGQVEPQAFATDN